MLMICNKGDVPSQAKTAFLQDARLHEAKSRHHVAVIAVDFFLTDKPWFTRFGPWLFETPPARISG